MRLIEQNNERISTKAALSRQAEKITTDCVGNQFSRIVLEW